MLNPLIHFVKRRTAGMGCCLGRPVTHILNDPTVAIHTTVGDIAIVRRYSSTLVKGCCNGVMYVRPSEGLLYYETKCGSSLCCRCCRHSFAITDISRVEVIENGRVLIRSGSRARSGDMLADGGEYLDLHPGLKIIFGNSAHPTAVIHVAMPDAKRFVGELKEIIKSE